MANSIYPAVDYIENYEIDDLDDKILIMTYRSNLRVVNTNNVYYLIPMYQRRRIPADSGRKLREETKIDCLKGFHAMVYYYEHVPTEIDPNHGNYEIYKVDPNQEPEVDRIIKLLEL